MMWLGLSHSFNFLLCKFHFWVIQLPLIAPSWRFWSSNFHAGCSPACNVNSIQAIHASTEKTKICGLPSVCQKCPTCSVTFYWLDCFSKLCGPFGDKNAQTEANSPPALPGRCTLSQLGQLFIVQLNKWFHVSSLFQPVVLI